LIFSSFFPKVQVNNTFQQCGVVLLREFLIIEVKPMSLSFDS
jgi:hypothetical protein